MMRWVGGGLVAGWLCVACSPSTTPEDAPAADAAALDTMGIDGGALDAPATNDGGLDAPPSDAPLDAPSSPDARDAATSPDVPLTPCGDPTLVTVVADADPVAHWTSIAVDGAGQPQIVSSPYGEAPRHYTRAAGTWTGDPQPGGEGLGAIAVEADGTAHIVRHALVGMFDYDVSYSRRAPDGTWLEEDTRLGAGTYPVIALDDDGVPHVAYNDGTTFRFAVRESGGTWATETIPTVLSPGSADLLVGPDGTVHVAVQNRPAAGDVDLVYAARTPSGTWSTEVVDAVATRGTDPSIALDGAGTVHVVYTEILAPFAVYYASRPATGTWTSSESFGAGTVASWNPRIAVDEGGRLHVVFRDNNYNLWYATRTAASTWDTTVLRSGDTAGSTLAFALDGSGLGHLSYGRNGSYALIYGELTLCP